MMQQNTYVDDVVEQDTAYTATHCNTLQHTATHCNTLQHTATDDAVEQDTAYVFYCIICQGTCVDDALEYIC